MYFNHSDGRFFQIDVMTTGAPRLAGHNDQVVFYNKQTRTFNAIQVSKVYTYSDARAKTGITAFSRGKDVISALRPVTYNYVGNETSVMAVNEYTEDNSIIINQPFELEAGSMFCAESSR